MSISLTFKNRAIFGIVMLCGMAWVGWLAVHSDGVPVQDELAHFALSRYGL